jgi:hypothetical protein
MEDNATPIEKLFDKAGDYSKTTLDLIKLNAIDKSADFVSFVTVRMTLFIVVALFFLIINIGIALWLGELVGKLYYGFFIIAGFYALLAILLYVFRLEWIKVPVSNSVITQLLRQKEI